MKIAVIYWSGTGNTEAMANAIVEGMKEGGAEVELFQVSDFDESTHSNYDRLVFGCPAMGDEVLEEEEFEPFFTSIEGKLKDREIGIFGSYEWNDGDWMRNWEKRVKDGGIKLLEDGLMIYDAPDADGLEKCKEFGKRFAK
ncbi:MAG: flavodoxin [Treponema sp.]|nr:MAG: flavodoxin [Treponema sp.]